MSWVSLFLALVKMVAAIGGYLREKQLLDAGTQRALAALLREQADEMQKAAAIREKLDADLAAHPDKLRDDDGFRRD